MSATPSTSRDASADGAAAPVAGNRLLAALARRAPDDAAWLQGHLTSVTLASGEVLAPAGKPILQVYFPETSVMSVINRMADGGAVEVGTVGHEGFATVEALLDGGASINETIAQIPGTALTAPVAVMLEAVESRSEMRHLLNRYANAYLAQVAQTAACNRLHDIESRCARWLLMTHDRVGQDSFPLTQEFLAIMLGVRRAGVTVAAGALQAAGLIRYRRGGIRVLDREGLERAGCECYGVVRRHFDQVLE
jgi:CRP-like cAMP-binding protein